MTSCLAYFLKMYLYAIWKFTKQFFFFKGRVTPNIIIFSSEDETKNQWKAKEICQAGKIEVAYYDETSSPTLIIKC